jgi:hypothetical protein
LNLSNILMVCVVFLGASIKAQDHAPAQVKIQVDPETIIAHISSNFIGFGYETAAVAQSNFFTPRNTTMVRLYRNLRTNGLIRIGGIISDHTKYIPDGEPAPRSQSQTTVINRDNLVELGGFARASGWKVMWGLNLGTGSKEEAVQEALAVNAAVGTSLQSFQIGNEVEALRRFNTRYDAFHTAYLDYKAAIRAVLPDAPFSGPDSIGNLRWITNFASTESADVKLLTIHYYRGGAGDTKSTLERLLADDEGLENRLNAMRAVSREHNLPFRINEVNSFSGGGKPGVSDTFGSALWCLDFMFRLASYGCDGVNMETDVNQLGFISHYSPIIHDSAGHYSVRPEYYGMLAFSAAANGDMVRVVIDNADVNLTAYATKDEQGVLWLTMVNKDFSRDAAVRATVPGGFATGAAVRLLAPSMESKDHVTFGGMEVLEEGKWAPGPWENLTISGGAASLIVPHASAAVVFLRP